MLHAKCINWLRKEVWASTTIIIATATSYFYRISLVPLWKVFIEFWGIKYFHALNYDGYEKCRNHLLLCARLHSLSHWLLTSIIEKNSWNLHSTIIMTVKRFLLTFYAFMLKSNCGSLSYLEMKLTNSRWQHVGYDESILMRFYHNYA